MPPRHKATSASRLNSAIFQQDSPPQSPRNRVARNFAALKVATEIRIDIESEGPDVVLHVAGRLTGPAITQLSEACEPMEGHLVLDLSKLRFADDPRAEVIRTFREKGAHICGASSFIKLLINGETGQKYEEC